MVNEKIYKGENMFFKKKKSEPKRTLEDMIKKPSEEEVQETSEKTDDVGENAEKKEPVSTNKEKVEEPPVELNALFCFGWKEDKTEKWMIKCAKVWYAIMSFFWFVLGALSFAPVIFISNKSNVLFKDKKMSFIFAIALYCILIVLLIILLSTKKVNASV